MAKDLKAVSDGTFIFSETENENQFYFYRKDGEILTDIDNEPMEFYQALITRKMMNGEIPAAIIANNMYSEMSADGKVIRVTVCGIGEDPNPHTNPKLNKKPSHFRRLINKVFGK